MPSVLLRRQVGEQPALSEAACMADDRSLAHRPAGDATAGARTRWSVSEQPAHLAEADRWVAHDPCRKGGRPADGGNPGPGKQPAQQQEANAGRASTRWVTIRMNQRARLPNRRRTVAALPS